MSSVQTKSRFRKRKLSRRFQHDWQDQPIRNIRFIAARVSNYTFHPGARSGRSLDGVQHSLHCDRGVKIIGQWLLAAQRSEKIPKHRNKGMLVANDVSGLPEIFRVGMIRSCHADVAHPLLARSFCSVDKFQLIHLFQIETQHTLRTIDFEGLAITAAYAVPGRLKRANMLPLAKRASTRVASSTSRPGAKVWVIAVNSAIGPLR